MLLKQYLLLNLGTVGLADALGWLDDMTRRRRQDACRDLLAFWQPREPGEAVLPGQLMVYAVVKFGRLESVEPVARLVGGLQEAARRALGDFGVRAEPVPGRPGLQVGGLTVCSLVVSARDGLAVGRVRLEAGNRPGPGAVTVAQLVGRPVRPAALANAFAYHYQDLLGYEPAAVHPVAYEEAMRGQRG